MAVAIKALEEKGVRVNESDFRDEDIVRHDQYVVVFRGAAADLFDCIFKGVQNGGAAHHLPHGADALVTHGDLGVDIGHGGSVKCHEREIVRGDGDSFSLPNV